MLSTDDAGQADLLNSIVTITDLLLPEDRDEARNNVETLEKLIEAIARLKGVLIGNEETMESFGECGGFESLLKAVENGTILEQHESPELPQEVDDSIDETESPRDEIFQLRKELLQLAFAALSQVLASNANAKHFFSRINGYTQLETIICSSQSLSHVFRRDYIFGNLFAAAINDFTHCHIFSSMRWHLNSDDLSNEEKIDRIAFKIQAAFESTEQLPNPEFIPIIVNLLPEILPDQDLGIAVCAAIQIIVDTNRANQLAFFNSPAHSHMIKKIILQSSTWATESLSEEQNVIIEDLIFSLSPLGLPLSLATSVVSAAVQRTGSTTEASLLPVLQQFATQSRLPPHFHFDMHPNGYSALTFASMTPPFPPVSAAGYTISTWLRIEKFDPDMHLTLFGVLDTSQKCFCMAYIEQDTHKIVLQTSLRSSVRFKMFEFSHGRWYHVVITHKRPRTTSSAKALLYVDGALVDQVKCSYPSSPPTSKSPIQAFFGTPPTFATSNTKPILQWSLAQAHVWADLLPEDLIEIIFQLGPRYHGNFQDSLGQFQTYDASTALNIRLGQIGGAKAEKSVLMAAVRGKGGTWAPESKLLLSVSPLALASQESDTDMRGVLNCGVSRISDALALENGIGTTIGSPVIVIPQSMDDSIWCLGGCAIGLRMVEKASSADELFLAVKVLFEVIRLSWRNSEDMERCHGYEILAFLLKAKKRDFITAELLQLVAEFIGVDSTDPRLLSVRLY
jgi:beige protein homolog 1